MMIRNIDFLSRILGNKKLLSAFGNYFKNGRYTKKTKIVPSQNESKFCGQKLDRQTDDIQTEKQTNRQIYRQTDRQTD